MLLTKAQNSPSNGITHKKVKVRLLIFFNDLSATEQQKFFHLVKRMGDFGFISDKTKFRNEDDGIYAFKPQPNRFLSFFYEGGKIIITNAFVKKSQKLKKQDKDIAISARNDYLTRVKENTYYDTEQEHI